MPCRSAAGELAGLVAALRADRRYVQRQQLDQLEWIANNYLPGLHWLQADRLLNQLLVETDGLDSGGSDGGKVVILIGATSRPEGAHLCIPFPQHRIALLKIELRVCGCAGAAIDGALLRPGRLDQLLYIPLPKEESNRMDILSAVTRTMPLCKSSTQPGEDAMQGAVEADVVRLEDIAAQTEGFSGADLRELCQQAGEIALTESIARTTPETVDDSDADEDAVDDVLDVVCHRHFEEALQSTRRSVSDAEAARYDRLCQSLRSGEAMPPPPEEEAVPPPEAIVGSPTPESPAVVAGQPVVCTPLPPACSKQLFLWFMH